MRPTLVLGIFLDIIAVIALLIVVVVPVLPGMAENPTVRNVMAQLVCESGETAEIEVIVTQDSDGTGYTPNVTCIGREGERADRTGKLFIIAAVVFVVPFLLGLMLTMNYGFRQVRKNKMAQSATVQDMARIINTQGATSSAFSMLDAGLSSDFKGSGAKAASGDLVSKLKQLEQARDGGLITQSEYDRMRQEILDKMA